MSEKTIHFSWIQGLGIAIACTTILSPNHAIAQITPDNTLPNNSQVRLDGTTRIIEGGTTRGTNLFHSFQEFSIPNNSSAFFNNAANIQNILTRVTGTSISNINGLISANGTANLFLLNPNGIVFGTNAQLNIGGSFLASTANSFKFPDGSEFSATNPQAPPLLAVNIVPGLQYGTSRTGATISNKGNLAPRQDLTLVADKLDLQGQLQPGRNLTLVGNQEINLKTDLTLNPITDGSIGKVSLTTTSGDVTTKNITTHGRVIEIQSGGGITTQTLDTRNGANNGGAITLIAINDINITGMLNSSSFSISTAGNGGAINIQAGNNINITDGLDSTSASVDTAKNGGAINIQAGNSINITGILDSSSGNDYLKLAGNAGDIDLKATNNITINGSLFSISSAGFAAGNGGNISLNTTNGNISTDSLYSFSFGEYDKAGNGGNISLNTRNGNIFVGDLDSRSSSFLSSVKNGGNISLKAINGSISAGSVSSFSFSVSKTSGNGGAINLEAAKNIQLLRGEYDSNIDAVKFVTGSVSVNSTGALGSGNITIFSNEPFTLDRSIISSDTFGSGRGGDIKITAPSISLSGGTQVSASSHSSGVSGNITFLASDSIDISETTTQDFSFGLTQNLGVTRVPPNTFLGGFIPTGNILERPSEGTVFPSGVFTQTTVGSTGNAGNLTIETGRLIIKEGGAIATTTFGQNSNAGNISIKADSIQVNNGSILSGVAEQAIGNSGKINLQTRSLDVTNSGIIQTQTLGQGTAGEIIVNATEQVNISGAGSTLRSSSGGNNSLLGGSSSSTKIGQGGNINLTTTNLRVVDNAVLDATTATNSPGGNITVNANNFQTTTGGRLLTSTSGTGNAGNITVNVQEAKLGANSGLFAQTLSSANAGNLTVQPLNNGQNLLVNLEDGAQISASTFNSGQGGTLTLKAPESITIRGNGSIISAETTGKGTGGDLTLETGKLTVRDQAQVTVSSVGSGQAGTLTVDANSVVLDNQGKIRADTTGGGGNIFINSPLLLLRRGSSITTNARGQDISGGNINIDAKNGFIIALPGENTDISANSVDFRGGNVTINNLAGLFGIQFRDIGTPNTNDITATGANSQLNGNVQINTPDVDPNNGLVELPIEGVDASSLISQNFCAVRGGSSFTITGRGGLPPSPNEALNANAVWEDWELTAVATDNRKNQHPPVAQGLEDETKIVPAQGWVRNEQGEVTLVATAPTAAPHGLGDLPSGCQPAIAP